MTVGGRVVRLRAYGLGDTRGDSGGDSDATCQEAGLEQCHMVSGAVVPAVNLPGVANGQLTLDGATLADIYLGAEMTVCPTFPDVRPWHGSKACPRS